MSSPRPRPGPAEPSSPGTARRSMLTVFMVVNMAIAGWILAGSVLSRAAPAADVAVATPPNPCTDAVERVQAYRAPGQREPLTDVIATNVATEGLRRPVAVVGWEPPRVWRGDCEVGLQLSIGNEPKTLWWAVRTNTGRVEALNDLAKQMSGW